MAVIIFGDDDIEAFFGREAKAQDVANANVKIILQPGDFYAMATEHGFTVYGEILDAAKQYLGDRRVEDLEEDEIDEYDGILDSYAQPHMRYYRFTRSFSKACPKGELGDVHLAAVTRQITKDEFETARQAEWP
jgi:hypothetical protein